MSRQDIFGFLANNTNQHKRSNAGMGGSVEPRIVLKSNTYGYYLQILDREGRDDNLRASEVTPPYQMLVERYNTALDHLWHSIDWEEKPQLLYLSKYEYLLEFLPHKAIVEVQDGGMVAYDKLASASVTLAIRSEDKSTYKCSVEANRNGETSTDVIVLSYNFIKYNDQLIRSNTMLDNIDYLPYILSSFPKDQLNLFMSILTSYITTRHFDLEGYTAMDAEQGIKARKALIIDRIDEHQNLYLKPQQIVADLADVDSLQKYNLTHIATISEEQKTVLVTPFEQTSDEVIRQDLMDKISNVLGKKLIKVIGIVPPYMLMGHEVAVQFLTQVLPDILDEYEIYGQEKLKDYKISYTKPRLNANLNPGLDYFEGDITIDFGDQSMDVFAAINLWKKNKYIKLENGQNALISSKYIQKLERLITKSEEGARISFFDLPIAEELLSEQLGSSVFDKHRSTFEGFNDIEMVKPPKSVKATLRDYQKYGVGWMLYLQQHNLNGCLADDMGLGKTLQTLTLLTMSPSDKPSIIIMPRTLLYNWASEIDKFTPHLTYEVYYGLDRNLDTAINKDIILTTYGLIRNDIEDFVEDEFHYIILDESQNIKNINAKSTKAVMLLKGQHRLALSGTPIENNLGELYSLFRFLNPAMFGSERRFNNQYIVPIQKNNDEHVTKELQKKIYPFIMRRIKRDVLKELPEKIENVVYVEQSPEQRKVYEERRQYYKMAIDKMIAADGIGKTQFFVFQAFAELRQLAAIPEAKTGGKVRSPKLEVLADHMIQSILNGHKVLVFANFVAAVEHVSKLLDDNNIHHVSMTGSTSSREKLVSEFSNNEECKAFVMTLKTGGTGLNLTQADIVYIFDPWWNVAAETQAIDRAHRIGQQKTVISYRLITKDTIEEKILQLQNMKRELFDNLISSDGAVGKSLTPEDIQYLLR